MVNNDPTNEAGLLRRVNLANLCIGPLILLGSHGLSRRRCNHRRSGVQSARDKTHFPSHWTPFGGHPAWRHRNARLAGAVELVVSAGSRQRERAWRRKM